MIRQLTLGKEEEKEPILYSISEESSYELSPQTSKNLKSPYFHNSLFQQLPICVVTKFLQQQLALEGGYYFLIVEDNQIIYIIRKGGYYGSGAALMEE